MRRLAILLICILFTHLSISCQKESDEPQVTDIEIDAKSAEIIDADNQFGSELFQLILEEDTETSNIMISPLSVSLALAMAYNGANGDTQTQMEQVLHQYGLT